MIGKERHRKAAFAGGASGFVAKPIDAKELMVCVFREIERKRLQELAAFGRKNMDPSLQMMVHDLKNVLTVIETNLELMELKKFQDCEQSVQISRHNSRVLFYLIQDMSDIWKLQAGKGLGLAFCRLAAEGHGGSIRYVSGGKTGNHITLELPAGNQS